MIITKTTLSAAIFGIALLGQTSGNKSPKEPANVIIDTKGLSIDLKWATNKNESTALTDADLDLDVLSSEGEILSSYNKSEFEHVNLTSILADGTYTIKVSLFEMYKKSKYTLSVTGAACGKNFNATGVLKEGVQPSIDVIKIVKSGDQFTLTTI
ncbi:MAG TPA: hypothetical protein VK589_06500 [Chryseolinea sp.]|nr:hypothetical protein [Chryseolinea sp.]